MIRVNINGRDHYIEPRPGLEGMQEFEEQVRKLMCSDRPPGCDAIYGRLDVISFNCSIPDPTGANNVYHIAYD